MTLCMLSPDHRILAERLDENPRVVLVRHPGAQASISTAWGLAVDCAPLEGARIERAARDHRTARSFICAVPTCPIRRVRPPMARTRRSSRPAARGDERPRTAHRHGNNSCGNWATNRPRQSRTACRVCPDTRGSRNLPGRVDHETRITGIKTGWGRPPGTPYPNGR